MMKKKSKINNRMIIVYNVQMKNFIIQLMICSHHNSYQSKLKIWIIKIKITWILWRLREKKKIINQNNIKQKFFIKNKKINRIENKKCWKKKINQYNLKKFNKNLKNNQKNKQQNLKRKNNKRNMNV